ncbi:MAG: acetate kinase [Pseudobutyrivibrio sp.]|nr:acetate kinase [Pseudobutyrivibrio sp.]
MKILVINCGSSSLKYQVIDSESEEVLCKGLCERIGIDGRLVYQKAGLDKEVTEIAMPTHKEAVASVIEAITNDKTGAIASLDEIDAVGHRVVHGGEKFAESALITDEMIKVVEECNDLAPLHNPANIIGINACRELMPGKPMVGVFDTAFHQTMPQQAYMYAVPYKYYEQYGVRRYGFHGTSHSYVSKRVCEMDGCDLKNSKIIVCHIGNGASCCAVLNGESVDTSMGLSPLEGLVMGTRSGDIDPSAVEFMAKKEGLDFAGVMNVLNKESGALGVSGISSDFRDLIAASAKGDKRAKLAMDMIAYRIAKYVGAYAAAMNGADIICFTAGLGENNAALRQAVCDHLGFMGVELDATRNDVAGEERLVSSDASKVKVYVVPTNEEVMIARDTASIVSNM